MGIHELDPGSRSPSITPVCHFSQFYDGFGAVVNHSTRCGWWIAIEFDRVHMMYIDLIEAFDMQEIIQVLLMARLRFVSLVKKLVHASLLQF